MGLLSFLKRKTPGARAAALDDAMSPEAIRGRVRRRFIGAALLVLVAVVVLPLVFETKPRPMPVDVAIDIPRRDSAPPLPMPAPRASQDDAPASPAEPPAPAAPVVAKPPPSAPAAAATPPAARPAPPPRTAEAPKAEAPKPKEPKEPKEARAKPEPAKPAPRTAERAAEPAKPRETAKPVAAVPDGARAQAMLEGRAAEAPSRFVVQVGAFEQPSAARDARQRVEKLGLKTFQQDVETAQGKRIRVRLGPFNSREEAEKAVARLGAGGIHASVVPQ